MWSGIGFRLESRYFSGNQDGIFLLLLCGIGVSAIMYAVGEFPKYSNSITTNKIKDAGKNKNK